MTVLEENLPGVYQIHVWVPSLRRHVLSVIEASDKDTAMKVAEKQVQEGRSDPTAFSAAWTKERT